MDTIKDGAKSITYEDFAAFRPCWLTDEDKRAEHAEQLARYRAMRDRWTALDILRLDEVSADDRLWLVLREELLDAPILHEFACRCAERALSRVHNPDPRSIAAIEVKRKWLRGECTGFELSAAMDAAYEVAMQASMKAALSAEGHTEVYAAMFAAAYAAWSTAGAAAWAAGYTAAKYAGLSTARTAERNWQVAELIKMLED